MSVTGTVGEGMLALPDGGIAIVETNVGAALLISLAEAALATPLGLLVRDAVGTLLEGVSVGEAEGT